ncbi:MAG: hypothetical protein V3R90_15300, partial [Limibaculum sp.]
QLYLDGVHVDTFNFLDALPKGSNDMLLELRPGAEFDELYVVMEFENSSNGVRIADVLTLGIADIPDFDLTFDVKATDFDGDFVTDTFDVHIDSDFI